jgi:hypothetical protein
MSFALTVFMKHFCFNNICNHILVAEALFQEMDVPHGNGVGCKVGESL